MNRIFRKVFNAKRGALVAVDETRTGHSQAAGEGVCGGTHESASRSTGEKIPSGVRTLIAAAVAGVLMGGMTLPASAEDFKISGDITRLVTPLGNNDYVENFLSGWTYNVTSKTGDDGKVHNGGLQLALYNPDGTIKGNLYRDAYIQKGSTLNFLSPDTTLIGRHIYNSGNLKLASTLAFQVQDINHLGGTLEISAVGTANKLVVSADGASITGGAVHYAGGIEVKDQGGLSITGGGTTASAFTQTGGVTKVGGKTATGSLLTLEGAATVSGGEFVWLGGADSLMKITAADGFKLQGGTLTIGGEGAGSAGANWQADEKDLYASGLIQVKNGGSFLGLTDKVMEVGKGLKVVNGGRMGFDGGLRIAGGEVVQNSGSADIRASGTFEMTDGTLTLDYKDDQTTVVRGLEVTGLTQDAVISGGTINALHGRGMHFSGANAGLRITGGAFNLGATSLTSNMTDAGATGTSILITGGTFAGGEEIAGKMNYALIEGENDVRIEGKAAFADGNVRLTSSQGRVAFNLDKGTASYLNDITSLAKSLQVLGDSVVSAKNVRTTGGDGATPDIAAGASLTADAFQIQGENSVYTNAGSLSANRIVWDELGTAHQGTFVNSGTAVFGTLADQTDGSSLKLTMKGANAKLVVTDKSFVKNSAIRIEDGAKMNLRDYGLSTLGQGNDYVVENTAFNTQLKGDAQHLISASAFDGMSVLQVDRLTSEGTVTLNQGGLLKAGTVALDGTQATVHLTGGAIMTSLAGMFEGVTSSTLLVTAESPDDTADIESQYLGVSTMGNLKTGVATGIDWQSGTIAFTDASITTGVVTDAVNAIGTAAGANQGQVAVVFTGKIVGGSSTADGFTIDTLRSLEAEQKLQEGSAFISPGIILSGTTLKNSTTEGSSRPIFIVAAAESTDSKAYTSTQSIGFSKIECAIEAHVLDGKTLVLTGVERKGNDDWKADSSALLVNGSAVTGTSFSSRGFISAENGGTIQLGTPGLAWKTAGNVGEIAIAGDGSALSVVNGEFGTVKLGLGKGASATIRDTGTLHVDRYMTVEGASMTVAGAFIHESSAQAGDELLGRHETNGASASSTFQDLTVGSTGLLKVDGKGAEKGEVLKLLAGAQHEVISGTSEWKELKTAQGAVTTIGASGTLKLTSDPTPETGDFAGTIVNSGRFETAQESPIHTGTFTNKGVHTATNGVGAFFQDLNIIGGTHLNDAAPTKRAATLQSTQRLPGPTRARLSGMRSPSWRPRGPTLGNSSSAPRDLRSASAPSRIPARAQSTSRPGRPPFRAERFRMPHPGPQAKSSSRAANSRSNRAAPPSSRRSPSRAAPGRTPAA